MAEAVAGAKNAPKAGPPNLGAQLLRVAWMSILLGVALEVVVLVLAGYAGTGGSSPKPFLADLAQKVSWGFIVCVGLAFGSAASKAREGVMGVLGLISAPLGFGVARSIHKGTLSALGVEVGGAAFPFLIAGLKALEYGVLGALVAYLMKRNGGAGSPASAYVAAGAGLGLTFGAFITYLLLRAGGGTPAPIDIASKGLNELAFPIGCALVLYASNALGKRMPA